MSKKFRKKEIIIRKKNMKIYGVAYIPEGEGKFPLIIFGHGVGGAYSDNLEFAKLLTHFGLASFCFDFCGGGGHKSSGDSSEMSVMTEVEDFTIVLDESRDWSFVDPRKIVLLGISQGGIVAAITAARNKEKVAGLILEFPAFVITDAMHNMFGSLENIPKVYYLFDWLKIGYPYAFDMWDYDVYSEIVKYDKKVLLLHGDSDPIVPIEYSKKAAALYKDVEFHILPGSGHGFYGQNFTKAFDYILNYLQQIGILPKKSTS